MAAPSRASHRKQKGHKIRHGKHQKHTKNFLNVYWPYIPLLIVVVAGLIFSNLWESHSGVLAYATSMSRSSLLSNTNSKRSAAGAGALTLNSKLNSAAQSKANDMTSKDYWSHNTPSGDPPWVFIDAAGYEYFKAGENLAYGFATSSDVITGWMNSATHKANMLDKNYKEVGFGFANSADFVNTGPQTVVVAMYGDPETYTAPTTVKSVNDTTKSTAPTTKPKTTTPTTKKTDTSKVEAAPKETNPKPEPKPTEQPTNTENPVISNEQPAKVSKISVLMGGALPWVTSAITLLGITTILFFVARHSWKIRKLIKKGERYILHHAVFDIAIVSLIGLCFIVTSGAGVIL